MLKVGDLAHREDREVRGSKSGNPNKIGGYHMYVHTCPPNATIIWCSKLVSE